jgi:hypothetical protein
VRRECLSSDTPRKSTQVIVVFLVTVVPVILCEAGRYMSLHTWIYGGWEDVSMEGSHDACSPPIWSTTLVGRSRGNT